MCIPSPSPPFQYARNNSNKVQCLMTGYLPEEDDKRGGRSISEETVKGNRHSIKKEQRGAR